VIAALGVRPGDRIADIGAGTGYFALPLARAAGSTGKVWAVDAQAEMLALLKERAGAESTIEPVLAEARATTLADSSCTLVFLANVWHEVSDRNAMVHEADRILKSGGRVAVLDWRPDVEPVAGPPLEHRLSPETARNDLLAAGFENVTARNVGAYSWLVMASRGEG